MVSLPVFPALGKWYSFSILDILGDSGHLEIVSGYMEMDFGYLQMDSGDGLGLQDSRNI